MTSKVRGTDPDEFPSERDEVVGAPESEHVGIQNVDDFADPSDDEVAARAYQRYLERGGADGQDLDDWLAAKEELRHRPRRAEPG